MATWRWANVPLPEPHLGGLGLGVILHLVQPWPLVDRPLAHVLGWPLVVAGASLAAWAVAVAAGVDLGRPSQLVTRGPFGLSRNPMYVAWTLVYMGATLLIASAWPLVLLPAVLLLTHLAVLGEERRLRHRLGEEYRRYASSVRRYL